MLNRKCPFCEKDQWEINSDQTDPKEPVWFVVCLACGATGPASKTRQYAGAAWKLRGYYNPDNRHREMTEKDLGDWYRGPPFSIAIMGTE
jgi:hypothetical protein